eukprot:jgi/Tetstr1/441512/TSEL_029743.t1
MLRMLKVYLAAQGNAWVPSNHEVVGHNKLSKWGGTMHTAAKNGALQSDYHAATVVQARQQLYATTSISSGAACLCAYMDDADKKVLSYHDVLLRRGDVDLLRGPHWLNDQIIAFYFEYLGRECVSRDPPVAFIPPSMTFLLANCGQDGASQLIDSLQLGGKQVVVFAVNNNPDAACAGGGSHWSTLALFTRSRSFVHLDSSAGTNAGPARQLHAVLSGQFGGRRLEEGQLPQQENSYDCGVFVIAVADAIAQLADGTRSDIDIKEGIPAHVDNGVKEKRGEVLQLIEDRRGSA